MEGGAREPPRRRRQATIRKTDFVVLEFVKYRMFARVDRQCRINKRTYSLTNLVGKPFGTLLEIYQSKLAIVEDSSEDLVPPVSLDPTNSNDNRNIHDDNQAQSLPHETIMQLRQEIPADQLVQKLVDNSKTFSQKSVYAQEKYIAQKQAKHRVRCRVLRPTALNITDTFFSKDAKRLGQLRSDTLAQMLSYANISAGKRTLIYEDVGLVTGAVAERTAGYGTIFSLYSKQQPHFDDILSKFNFDFLVMQSIQWVHTGDIFGEFDPVDHDKVERDKLEWPIPLQEHTRTYIDQHLRNKPKKLDQFLVKRQQRFTRKICRQTPVEAYHALQSALCDSLILATKSDSIQCFEKLFPYLAPSCPFVVFSEFLEPLVQLFDHLQKNEKGINMRLSDTWTREYQVLPNRTHPNMSMSQNGGFLLHGIKLDEKYGINTLDPEKLEELKASYGNIMRGRKAKKPKLDKER